MKVPVSIVVVMLLALFGPGQVWASADGPGVPVDLKAAVSGKGVRLIWKAPPENPELVTGYEIARASLASGPFKALATVGPDVQVFLDTGAKPEVIYFYKIRAVGKESDSPFSKLVSAEISGVKR
jgi:hypothetical protein